MLGLNLSLQFLVLIINGDYLYSRISLFFIRKITREIKDHVTLALLSLSSSSMFFKRAKPNLKMFFS